jgi:hypothetical protein
VHLDPGGNDVVTTKLVTAAQSVALREARFRATAPQTPTVETRPASGEELGTVSEAISQDLGCGIMGGLALYDGNQGCIGGPNPGFLIPGVDILCFDGSGTAALGNYCRVRNTSGACISTWAGNVTDYWPGAGDSARSGRFAEAICGFRCSLVWENFSANQPCTVADSLVQHSVQVQLN